MSDEDDCDLWAMAFSARANEGWYRTHSATFAEGAEWGAGWAFAIIGMAEAIRIADQRRRAIDHYVTYGKTLT